jgi:uncharacterized protein (DUF1697 family)
MALVVFLRGVNVGGHRTFRPSLLAKELSRFDVVNIGAAGTFVVRKPGTQAKFRAALRSKLPFETDIAICPGREIIQLETENPFGNEKSSPGVVRFVTVMPKSGGDGPSIPFSLPPTGQWLVRIIGAQGRYVFGEYRRHMKTIGYLSQLDKEFKGKGTTRNWNTMMAIVRILKQQG